MALRRPGWVQRTFDLDILDCQPRTVPFLATDLMHRARIHEAIREHHDRGLGLHVSHKLVHSRFAGRRVKIPDQAGLSREFRAGRRHAEGHRLTTTLKGRCRNPKPIIAPLGWIELSRPDTVPFRRAKAHHLAVLEKAIHVFGRSPNWPTVFDAVALLGKPRRLGTVSDRGVQSLLGRLEVFLHQER